MKSGALFRRQLGGMLYSSARVICKEGLFLTSLYYPENEEHCFFGDEPIKSRVRVMRTVTLGDTGASVPL